MHINTNYSIEVDQLITPLPGDVFSAGWYHQSILPRITLLHVSENPTSGVLTQ